MWWRSQKKLVSFKAEWDTVFDIPIKGPLYLSVNRKEGMVYVVFKNLDELKKKVEAYVISQLPSNVRDRAKISFLEYKIIEEI